MSWHRSQTRYRSRSTTETSTYKLTTSTFFCFCLLRTKVHGVTEVTKNVLVPSKGSTSGMPRQIQRSLCQNVGFLCPNRWRIPKRKKSNVFRKQLCEGTRYKCLSVLCSVGEDKVLKLPRHLPKTEVLTRWLSSISLKLEKPKWLLKEFRCRNESTS